jgi:hypothetical protein
VPKTTRQNPTQRIYQACCEQAQAMTWKRLRRLPPLRRKAILAPFAFDFPFSLVFFHFFRRPCAKKAFERLQKKEKMADRGMLKSLATIPAVAVAAGIGFLWYLEQKARAKDLETIKALRADAAAVMSEVAALKAQLTQFQAEALQLQTFETAVAGLKNLPSTGDSKGKKAAPLTKRVLRIGTRDSILAMWQAKHIAKLLKAVHSGLECPLVGMKTLGDNVLDVPLSSFTNKGIFTKELDAALISGTVLASFRPFLLNSAGIYGDF